MRYNIIVPAPEEKERVRRHIAKYSGYRMEKGTRRPTYEPRTAPILYPGGMGTFARLAGVELRNLRYLLNRPERGCTPQTWASIMAQVERAEGPTDDAPSEITEEDALTVLAARRGIDREKLRNFVDLLAA